MFEMFTKHWDTRSFYLASTVIAFVELYNVFKISFMKDILKPQVILVKTRLFN